MNKTSLTGGGTGDSIGSRGHMIQINKIIIYTDGIGNSATVTMTDGDGANCLPASGLRVNGYGCSEGSAIFKIEEGYVGPLTITLTGTSAEGIVYYQEW